MNAMTILVTWLSTKQRKFSLQPGDMEILCPA